MFWKQIDPTENNLRTISINRVLFIAINLKKSDGRIRTIN
ncbi:hypothetical protein LBBP_02137 [Leptospira borgpetersenii serovar Ballum]|uniref:Uncharacterized protein n=1 Tax=Leptospira borgpetersenii serovar Ballum TaxID=280505 RepID=A0A0S2IRW9_LEPBO|nr:hypothetical protein LBBP_02137 [Leptospira borgpetersenii serovar Ballum]